MSPPPSFSLSPADWRTIFNRWKYLLGLAVGLALAISTAVAFSLPDSYSSVAVFLPTSLQSADPDRLAATPPTFPKLALDVQDEDLDRVISIGESLPVAEQMLRQFDLYHHYGQGDPDNGLVDNRTLQQFTSHLSLVHNEHDAIELTFEDHDKELAARVANAMVAAIDSINQQLTLENRRNALELYRQRSVSLGRIFEQTRQALVRARQRYGIFSLEQEQESRYLAKAVIETEKELRVAEAGGPGHVAGLRRALRGLTRADGGNAINLESFTQGNDSVMLASVRLADIGTRFVAARAAYEQAETVLGSRVSSLYLLQKAQPATRKSKPFRGFIVFSSVVLTLTLSLLVILLLELYRRR